MIAFEDYSLQDLQLKKDDILQLISQLLSSPEFLLTIDRATGNTEVMNKRLFIFRTRLGEIMHEQNEGEN